MKIQNNPPTRSAANAREGRTAADRNQLCDINEIPKRPNKYSAIIYRCLRMEGEAFFEAESYLDALEKARNFPPTEVKNWDLMFEHFGFEYDSIVLEEGERNYE